MMKKTLLLALLAAPLAAMAQQYKVVGVMPEGATTVYLRNMQTPRGQQPDSVVLKDCANGRFSFEGDTEGKMFATVYTDREGNDAIDLVLDGTVNVDFAGGTVKGTAENKLLAEAKKQLQPFASSLEAILDEYRKLGQNASPDDRARLSREWDEASKAWSGKVVEICRAHNDRIFPIVLLAPAFYNMEQADVIALADAAPAYLKTSYGARINDIVEGWRKQAVGVKFTDLEMPDTTGTMHKLSEYVGRGNYVLIDFWASWCGPCMAELPNVLEAYDKYHAKGFDVVGLSFDADKAAWTGAINNKKIPWHHLSDLKGWECLAGQVYGVRAIPATLLVGPDGVIVANGLRGEELQAKLKEIYGE